MCLQPTHSSDVQVQTELTSVLQEHEVNTARGTPPATNPSTYAPDTTGAPQQGSQLPAPPAVGAPRRPFQYGPLPTDSDSLDRTGSRPDLVPSDDPAFALLGGPTAASGAAGGGMSTGMSTGVSTQSGAGKAGTLSDNPFSAAGDTSADVSGAATANTGPDLINFDAMDSPPRKAAPNAMRNSSSTYTPSATGPPATTNSAGTGAGGGMDFLGAPSGGDTAATAGGGSTGGGIGASAWTEVQDESAGLTSEGATAGVDDVTASLQELGKEGGSRQQQEPPSLL